MITLADKDNFEEGDLVRFWTPEEAHADGVTKGPNWPGTAVPWGQIGEVVEAGITLPRHVKSPKVLFPNETEPRAIGPAAITLVERYDPVKELGEEYFA